MKKYFIQTGKGQEGPFSKEELSSKNISAKTMVWYEGISNWTEAEFIPELKEIATPIPPPFENKINISTGKTNENITNNTHQNQNPMNPSKEKNYKLPFVISTIVASILIILLIAVKFSSSASVSPTSIDKKIFTGLWSMAFDQDNFELNGDSSTYNLYLHGELVTLKGHWEIIDLNINNEKTSILILKNEIPTTGNSDYPEHNYYKFYFYSVDKITNGQIYLTDLTSRFDDSRMKPYRLKRK